MSGQVTCARCSVSGEPIAGRVPFRGKLKDRVMTSVCASCWNLWQEMQIKVINEFALNLGDPRSHDIIESHAGEFFGFSDE